MGFREADQKQVQKMEREEQERLEKGDMTQNLSASFETLLRMKVPPGKGRAKAYASEFSAGLQQGMAPMRMGMMGRRMPNVPMQDDVGMGMDGPDF